MTRVIAICLCVALFMPSVVLGQRSGLQTSCNPGLGEVVTVGRIGWLEHPRGLTISIDEYQLAGQPYQFRQEVPLRGTWLELSLSHPFGPALEATFSAGALIPTDSDGMDTVILPNSNALQFSIRSTDRSWRFIEGMASYDVAGLCQLLGGFRWDQLMTRFDFSSTDPARYYDIKIITYIPFLGLQFTDSRPSGRLTVRAIGTPFLPGGIDLLYHQPGLTERTSQTFREGYFLECFAEYGCRLFDGGLISGYARWNSLYGRAAQGTYFGTNSASQYSGPARLGFRRNAWTLGGSVSVAVDLLSWIH